MKKNRSKILLIFEKQLASFELLKESNWDMIAKDGNHEIENQTKRKLINWKKIIFKYFWKMKT
jgi:hypothetical protein